MEGDRLGRGQTGEGRGQTREGTDWGEWRNGVTNGMQK